MANPLAWISEQARYLLRGPGSSASNQQLLLIPPPEPTLRTSLIFESHMQEAGKSRSSGKARNPQTISSAWEERGQWGENFLTSQGLTPQERKAIMLDIYLNIPAASGCVDVISKRIFSGGVTVEKVDEEAKDNNQHYDQLMEFLLRINPDWDFMQLGRSLVTDKLIFGECYSEIINKNGLPFNLIKVDAIPMGYQANRYGQIERFYQQFESSNQKNWLDPANIIRWWFPHPRASIDPFAPVEKVNDAVILNKKMTNWQTSFFAKGAKFPFYVKGVGSQDEADRYMAFFTQNNTGEKNAHKPMITWGTAELAALGNMGAMDIDFEKGLDRTDTIVYGAFGVPPSAVSIIKVGALGGNSGEDQDKSLIYNACDPVKMAFFEKLNDRIVKRGFGITDYKISSRYADYRSDESVATVQDIRIKNGSRTINETRQEDGRRPYKNGGDVAVLVTTKDVTPVPRLDALSDEQAQTAQVTLDTAKAGADLAKTKAKQAKEPPPVQPPAVSDGQAQPLQKAQQNVPQKATAQAKQPAQQESVGNTGVMVALMIPPEIGKQIVIAGGEPVEDLHITLAYLGEATDIASQIPVLKQALQLFASTSHPLSGRIAGLGHFDAPEGQPIPIIALPDIPGLPEFRQALTGILAHCGTPANAQHGYTPHITLAYIDVAVSMPVEHIPHLNLSFDSICLAIGDERTYFPLLGQKQETENHSHLAEDTSPVANNLWVRPDIDPKLQELTGQGVLSITWGDHPGSCDMCQANNGITVKLGQTFPSGHQLAPAHPRCICSMIYTYADGSASIEKSIYDPNATTDINDPDATQKLPAIKVRKVRMSDG